MKIKQSIFAKIFSSNILFLICAFLFLGISNNSHAETLKFSTTWGMLTVHSDDGMHYTGSYGKKVVKFTETIKQILELLPVFGTKPKSKKNAPLKEKEPLTGVRLNIL